MSSKRKLRAGDWVVVRSLPEIRETLDSTGALDGMPFMPEMVKYCGRRLRVASRAHKTCNTVDNTGGARVRDAVHLQDARCDGSSHGGCQAACLIFFKTQWLRVIRDDEAPVAGSVQASAQPASLPVEWSYATSPDLPPEQIRYRCQNTDVPNFSSVLPWWDVRQYLEDVTSGNVDFGLYLRGIRFAAFRAIITLGVGYRILRKMYNAWQRFRGRSSFPFVTGTLDRTPHAELRLQPGEWVRIRPFDDIVATLDRNCKNRGLGFDTCEMRLFCNGRFRVRERIRRIINERTGKMLELSNPCVTLEGVYCRGETTRTRLFCPRAITPYWREIWLERDSNQAAHD